MKEGDPVETPEGPGVIAVEDATFDRRISDVHWMIVRLDDGSYRVFRPNQLKPREPR